jgi:3-dehydroquinate synthase
MHGSDPRNVWDPAWRQAVLIADSNTDRLFGARVAAQLAERAKVLRMTIPAGESGKSREQKGRVEDAMIAAGIDRSACVVALGGGVVLDLAGFVAATYMRGIAHINIATTLLAQVDAAIGGKTAINTPAGKNLIGAFHQPRAVLLDGEALASLGDHELRNGLAEAIKHAVLFDRTLFETIEAWAASRVSLRPAREVVARCVAIKADVVARDERDGGVRHVLNHGHTVAHAIELATEHAVPHGQAVAMGMIVESRLAMQAGSYPAEDLARLGALLDALGLPTAAACSFDDALPFFARDKKTEDAAIRCALPARIGHIAPEPDGSWLRTVDIAALRRAWCAA